MLKFPQHAKCGFNVAIKGLTYSSTIRRNFTGCTGCPLSTVMQWSSMLTSWLMQVLDMWHLLGTILPRSSRTVWLCIHSLWSILKLGFMRPGDLNLRHLDLKIASYMFHTCWADQKNLRYPGTIRLIILYINPQRGPSGPNNSDIFAQVSLEGVDVSCLNNFLLQTVPSIDNTFREEVFSEVGSASIFLNFHRLTSGSFVHI